MLLLLFVMMILLIILIICIYIFKYFVCLFASIKTLLVTLCKWNLCLTSDNDAVKLSDNLSTFKHIYLAPIYFVSICVQGKIHYCLKPANNTKERNSSRLAFFPITHLKYNKGECNFNQPRALSFTKPCTVIYRQLSQ